MNNIIFDADMGSNPSMRDVAAKSPTPVDYNNISITAWAHSEEPVVGDSPREQLIEILANQNGKYTIETIDKIEKWAIASQNALITDLLCKTIKHMLDIYSRSRNAKLTTFALKRVFSFDDAATTTYAQKAKELGISEQAVSKICNKIADRFNVRPRTMHHIRSVNIDRILKRND